MKQTGQAMAVQSFNTLAGGGSIDDPAASRFLLSSAEAAVSRALGPSIPGYEIGVRGETAGSWNGPDRAGGYTLSSRAAAPVGSLPPSKVSAPPMATFRALQEWEGHVAQY